MAENDEIKKQDLNEIIPEAGSLSQNQEEYIRALEMSVQMLQREVEHLRSQAQSADEGKQPSQKRPSGIDVDYSDCSSEREVHLKYHKKLAENFDILESDIYFVTSTKALQPISGSDTSTTLEPIVKNFVEEGIIDWTLENGNARVIPNLGDELGETPTYFLLIPLKLRGGALGVFMARTSRQPNEFTDEDIQYLTSSASRTAIALDNIRSSNEIAKMNKRLASLNEQMLESTKMASIGELTAAIAGELETPVKMIAGHLDLLESGLGDQKRRLQIIREQLEKITNITSGLANLAKTSGREAQPAEINICSMINEALLFSGYQLQRDGISIDKEFEDESLTIKGSRSRIEQALLNLLLQIRDLSPEADKITIGVYKTGKDKVSLLVKDNGPGMDNDELNNILSSGELDDEEKSKTSAFMTVKNIIEEHSGSIEIFSEVGRGTTYKILLPVYR